VPDGSGFDVVYEVSELLWEPVASRTRESERGPQRERLGELGAIAAELFRPCPRPPICR
jgi:hypothetical protein